MKVDGVQFMEIQNKPSLFAGEPFDKAGGYGAQGPAGVWIKRLEGCYFNVMGLPLHDLTREIKLLIENGVLKL